jgi:hypothetical protein
MKSNVTKYYLALCLVLLLLFVSITYSSHFVSETDNKVGALSEELKGQSIELDELKSDIENMISQNESLIQQYEDMIQKYENMKNGINSIIEASQVHENCVAIAMLINSPSVLADEYERTEEEQAELYENDEYFARFYGRFYVPDAKIDVALYYGNIQHACDRQDSACLFTYGLFDGEYIADHNNQEFRKLFSVKVGMQGYIQLKNGDIINMECIDIFNGHNTGRAIIDENGNSAFDADYLTYTCRNGWRNIRICLWKRF